MCLCLRGVLCARGVFLFEGCVHICEGCVYVSGVCLCVRGVFMCEGVCYV